MRCYYTCNETIFGKIQDHNLKRITMEEAIDFDDEPEIIDLTYEKRIRKRTNTIDDRIMRTNYKFLKEDENPWTETSENSYEGDAGAEIREELGMIDIDDALTAALWKLIGVGWSAFLEDPYIRHMFWRVDQCIYNFADGAARHQVRQLWHLKWTHELDVYLLKYPKETICYLCNLPRTGCYSANDKSGNTVYLGPNCYDNRFAILLELVDVCYASADKLRSDIEYSIEKLREDIEAVLMKIGDGNRRMVKQFAKKKSRGSSSDSDNF